MNKVPRLIFFTLVVFLLILISSLSSQDKVSAAVAPNTNSSLKYFGFYLDGESGRAENNEYTNVTWYTPSSGDTLESVFQSARSKGQKVIYHFDCPWHTPCNDSTWNSLISQIQPHINDIAVFSIADEPEQPWPNSNWPAIKAKLETMAARIRNSIPNPPPLWVNFAAQYMLSDEPLPTGFDWYSFDCYYGFPVCTAGGGHGENVAGSVPDMVAKLEGKLHNQNQRIVLIPQAFTTINPADKAGTDSELVTRAEQFYNLARSNPKVVGIIPYVWFADVPNFVNLKDLPLAKAKFREIGLAIKQSQPTTPTLDSITMSAPNIKADNMTQYNIVMSASDPGGGAKIRNSYSIINQQGANVGAYRGYLAWNVGDIGNVSDLKNKQSCTGGGTAALIKDKGENFLNLISCATSVSGIVRTTTFTVNFDASFTTPATNNDISGYINNTDGGEVGWKNFDINFSVGNTAFSFSTPVPPPSPSPSPTPTPTPNPSPSPTPTPSPTRLPSGVTRVQTTSNLNVRASASPYAPVLKVQPVGSSGTIISGPVLSNNLTWYQIRYDNGTTGWSANNFLRNIVSASPTTQTSLTEEVRQTMIKAIQAQLQVLMQQLIQLMQDEVKKAGAY